MFYGMKMFKLMILAGFVTSCSFSFSEQENKAASSFKFPGLGVVSLLNIKSKKIDENCLAEIVKGLITLCDENKLDLVRTKIWKDHTIVKEVLSGQAVKIEREPAGKYLDILVPTEHNRKRIILYRENKNISEYSLYSLPENTPDIDFYECIK